MLLKMCTGSPYDFKCWKLMLRLHLMVLTTRNETLPLWKRLSKFKNSNLWLAVWNKLSILFTNEILRELVNKKIIFYKFSVRYQVVKPAWLCKRGIR